MVGVLRYSQYLRLKNGKANHLEPARKEDAEHESFMRSSRWRRWSSIAWERFETSLETPGELVRL